VASSETNEAKRELMSRVVDAQLRGNGWKPDQLAALMWVTTGTVRSWWRGDSMGTNAQRAMLAELKTPAEERPRLLEVAAQLRQEAEISDRRNAEAWKACAFGVQKRHAARAARLRERADFLETIGV
jgi:hypothetical protein